LVRFLAPDGSWTALGDSFLQVSALFQLQRPGFPPFEAICSADRGHPRIVAQLKLMTPCLGKGRPGKLPAAGLTRYLRVVLEGVALDHLADKQPFAASRSRTV
jgi:hypothetical protein